MNNPRLFTIVKAENISMGFIYIDLKVLEFYEKWQKSENIKTNDKSITKNSENFFLFQFKWKIVILILI